MEIAASSIGPIGIANLVPISNAKRTNDLSITTQIQNEENKAPLNEEQVDFLSQQQKLSQYVEERDNEFRKKYGNTLPKIMYAVAYPESADGASCFVTADQQRIIDKITEKYYDQADCSGLMEELAANNVHPNQIVANAKYFIQSDGQIVDKDRNLIFKNILDVAG